MSNENVGTCRIHLLSEAVSPITHMAGVSGNESILNREKVLFKNNIVDIPFISGNALRHRMIREPGALYLVGLCELSGELNIDQANYMFTGGSLTESSTTSNLKTIAKLQTASPFYRLLGGSLRNQVIGGSLFVSRGVLVCLENKDVLLKLAPSIFDNSDYFLMSEHFISKYQYTRGDASKIKDAPNMIQGDLATKSNLMIYNGETIIPGSLFYHDLILYNVSALEVGAALHSLQLWQRNGGTIGGSARIGHGKLSTSIYIETSDFEDVVIDPSSAVIKYIEHAASNKNEFRSWLKENFK